MKAKKSLGQNFLKSEPALRKMIEAGAVGKEDIVLEIGPGRGALTKKLLEYAGTVLAVEKDDGLYELLKNKFAEEIKSGSFILKHGDIMTFDIASLENYKIIANIPYNITGGVLKKFLTSTHQPERMILMVQKEVAERVIARDKKESLLSISVKAYGQPRLLMKVPARYFSPAPKVDSAILAVENISREFFNKNHIDEEFFWKILRAGFAHKRKKLSGNLKPLGILLPEALSGKRAEELTLLDWISLAKH